VKTDADQMIRSIARRVAELRAERGLTQTTLAERIGVASQSIHRIEQGEQNLTIRMMVRLANALDVHVLDLFERPARSR